MTGWPWAFIRCLYQKTLIASQWLEAFSETRLGLRHFTILQLHPRCNFRQTRSTLSQG